MIERQDVLFIASNDPDFKQDIHSDTVVIDDKITLEVYSDENTLVFRELTDKNTVDISTCARCEIVLEPKVLQLDIAGLLDMRMIDVVKWILKK